MHWKELIEWISQPWPWFLSGMAIAAIMVSLIYFGKTFGFSSNLRTLCTIAGAGRHVKFFDFDWKTQRWNLLFLLGAVLGGILSSTLLKNNHPMAISSATVIDLQKIGIVFDGQMNPGQLFGLKNLTFKGFLLLLMGGLLVGFGTRYAGGCTSGHAISGLSNLQFPSLVAVIGFFAGGLFMTHVLFPLLFT